MLGVAVLFFALVGCSKDDDNGAPTGGHAIEDLRTAILGKWIINNFPADLMVASYSSSVQLHTKMSGTPSRRMPTKQLFSIGSSLRAETGGAGSTSGFIEFLPDGTYIMQDAGGNILSGGYVVESGQSINLSKLGSISEVKFRGSNIDFKVSLSVDGDDKILQISANKAPEVTESEQTNLLTRTWEMVSAVDQDGVSYFDAEEGRFGFDNMSVDQLRVTFSRAGTYVVRYFYEGEVIDANTANWRWSPTDPDKLEYAWGDGAFRDEGSATIAKLTATELVTHEEVTDGRILISTLKVID